MRFHSLLCVLCVVDLSSSKGGSDDCDRADRLFLLSSLLLFANDLFSCSSEQVALVYEEVGLGRYNLRARGPLKGNVDP